MSQIEDFTKFYAKFEEQNGGKRHEFYNSSQDGSLPVSFNVEMVVNPFKQCKIKLSTGPDGISGRVLKQRAEELGPIFTYIFNWTFEVQ